MNESMVSPYFWLICASWCIKNVRKISDVKPRFPALRWHCLRAGTSASELRGLALDAERGLLYYTDYTQGVIAEITTSGSNPRVIYSDRNKRPRAIIVDSIRRWTNPACHARNECTAHELKSKNTLLAVSPQQPLDHGFLIGDRPIHSQVSGAWFLLTEYT